ncbi:hypothetical protein EK21DRAFT_101546 [Setomelanomma holmii]|uniref:Heterokaryon incompatibility domain-containing protein n=1 Tax=Setomelanomma holmii TaxID=210430 RepID=A0A9P4H5Z4_9PLEO|nr:hypothetical protein EK21DRAFT_101546 [Setomelanomma holmii]
MRLINVTTLQIETFTDNDIPPYAILSHTWGSDEISYEELVWINRIKGFHESLDQKSPTSSPSSGLTEQDFLQREGYAKIVNAARQAQALTVQWIWIDTCCIDKSSSAELSEAINSMYRYYSECQVCLVYLNDVAMPFPEEWSDGCEDNRKAFSSARWTKRGWTLQELIAPKICQFYYDDWQLMGEKKYFLDELSQGTGIPRSVLEDRTTLSDLSVAERMSWVANRETSRKEDIAYCLLGLFDIHMPLLYGEGDKAFIRLQEEILKTTDDYSIFAWSAPDANTSTYRGLLARSPNEFRKSSSIERENALSAFPIAPTPIGLRVQLELLPDPNDPSRMLGLIRSCNSMSQRLAIRLKCLDGSMQYARVDAGSLVAIDDWPTGQLRTIYVRHKLLVPADFATPEFDRFQLRRRASKHGSLNVRIEHASFGWDWAAKEYHIPPRRVGETTTIVAFKLQPLIWPHVIIFPVALEFNPETCHYWCKIMPSIMQDRRDHDDTVDWLPTSEVHVPDEGAVALNIDIKAGLCGDNIALIVYVDGLLE